MTCTRSSQHLASKDQLMIMTVSAVLSMCFLCKCVCVQVCVFVSVCICIVSVKLLYCGSRFKCFVELGPVFEGKGIDCQPPPSLHPPTNTHTHIYAHVYYVHA